MKKALIILSLILTTVIIIGCFGNNTNSYSDFTGETVSISLDKVTNTVQKYEYDVNGVKVVYFAVLGSDGEVRTAFDACDVCGGYKGYTQKSSDIECNNCGRVFSINGLGTKNKGYGCWPSYLGHKIENGNVLISAKELAAGAHRFA